MYGHKSSDMSFTYMYALIKTLQLMNGRILDGPPLTFQSRNDMIST